MTTVMAYIQPQTRTGSMSELGQTRHFDRAPITSGLLQQADLIRVRRHVSNVPLAVILVSTYRGTARQGNDEFGECARFCLHINSSAVLLHDDVISHRQAKARPFA